MSQRAESATTLYQAAYHNSTRGNRETARKLFFPAAVERRPDGSYVWSNETYLRESLKVGVVDEGDQHLSSDNNSKCQEPLSKKRTLFIVDLVKKTRTKVIR